MSEKPTPAEAMALWSRLDRPSSYEVAARFTAAGRPIRANIISRWRKQGWQRSAKAPRIEKPTPAEAQAMWDSLENPSQRKVADAFKAQGRLVCPRTICVWKRAGWSGVTAKAVWKATRATGAKAPAVPAPTGDATSALSDAQGAKPLASARASRRPTPAEVMARWYSLDRPTGAAVAVSFKAAGRPISSRTVTQWKKAGWRGVANAPRTDRPTPAEGKAIWDSLERPNFEKVAETFKAQGRPVSSRTISIWHQAGWSTINPKNVAGKINRAIEKMAAALPALTGDPTSTLSDIVTGHRDVNDELSNDKRSNDERSHDRRSNDHSHAEYVEHALIRALRTATSVNDAIHEMATAVPRAGDPVAKDAPLPLLLTQPYIAQLMMASNAGIGMSVEVARQLPALRAEEAAAIPGTQTIYPPGECRRMSAIFEEFRAKRERGSWKPSTPTMTEKYPDLRPCSCPDRTACPYTVEPSDTMRASIDAIDEALRKHREEQKPFLEQVYGGEQGEAAAEDSAAGEPPWGEIEDAG